MINSNSPFAEGVVINIDKPYGWTSTDIVRKIKPMLRKLGHAKIKIGHAGTLDPLATGVLLICVGKATKRVDELQAQSKEYVTTIEFGATTPSYDLEHGIDERYPWEHITASQIREVLAGFIGEQEQIPPVYSAKRIDGKRAYDYARDGQQVQMRKALITIFEAELISYEAPYATIRIVCSKGTYVRSLARDLGVELGSGAHLTQLRRTRSGDFSVHDAIEWQELEKKLGLNETK